MHWCPAEMAHPGARPWWLGKTTAPLGCMAYWEMPWGGVLPALAKRPSSRRAVGSCRSRGRPSPSQMVDLAKPSGPSSSPPRVMMMSLRRRAWDMARRRRSRSLAAAIWLCREIPSFFSSWARNRASAPPSPLWQSWAPTPIISAITDDSSSFLAGTPGTAAYSSTGSLCRKITSSASRAAWSSISARPGIRPSMVSRSATLGLVLGWRGVKTVQQSS